MKTKLLYKAIAIVAILTMVSVATVMAWTSMETRDTWPIGPFKVGNAYFEAAQVGTYEYAYKFDNWSPSTTFPWTETYEDNTITVDSEDGIYFNWTSTVPISAVIVKGGTAVNIFYYDPAATSDTGLYAPINDKTREPYAVSHVTFCWNVGEVPPQATISGVKYYDANVNGERDPGEVTIEGWKIELHMWDEDAEDWVYVDTAYTGEAGDYIFTVTEAGTYKVVEVMPSGMWVQTAPESGCYVITVTLGETYTDNDFGNVCLMPGTGGKTLGFWSNKNGQALISSGDVTALNALNLYKPSGWTYPPFSTKTQIKNYLLSATAVDMRWMLSAQLIATKLNVLHGFLSGSTIVYVGPSTYVPSGFISIDEIMNNANTALSGTDRAAQEYWKNLLDGLNNNRLPFVCPGPCLPIVYPP
jgi:hypothetical protein